MLERSQVKKMSLKDIKSALQAFNVEFDRRGKKPALVALLLATLGLEIRNTEEPIASDNISHVSLVSAAAHKSPMRQVEQVESSAPPVFNVNEVENMMRKFNGEDDYSILRWINEYNQLAEMLGLVGIKKLVYAKNFLTGLAKDVSQRETFQTYEDLISALKNEFSSEYSSHEIHSRLSKRLKKDDETFLQYFLKMTDIARNGELDEESVIHYIINGVKDSPQNKTILYTSKTLGELKKNFKIYESMRSSSSAEKFPSKFKNFKPSKTQKGNSSQVNDISSYFGLNLSTVKIAINGKILTALLDTGANVNLIHKRVVDLHSWSTNSDPLVLKAFNGSIEKISSSIPIQISNGPDSYILDKAHVSEKISFDIILGIETLSKLGFELSLKKSDVHCLIQTKHEKQESTTINNSIKLDESKIFSKEEALTLASKNTGAVSYEKYAVPFQLKEDAPIVAQKPYRLSKDRTEWAKEKIQDLLDRGIIAESTSTYASPCVIVPKENGSWRLCQDFRKVNDVTDQDPYPFPVIDDIISNFGGCRYFSKLDLKEGFHHHQGLARKL